MFLNLLLNVLSGATRGLVLMFLANWFIVPVFGATPIGFLQALGLYFTAKFLLVLYPYDVGMKMIEQIKSDDGYSFKSGICNVSFGLFTLLLAFLVKSML